MKKHHLRNKGALLLQAVMLVVILATIAVFMLKLTLSRQTMVAKNTNSLKNRGAIDGCIAEKAVRWNSTPITTDLGTTYCNNLVEVNVTGTAAPYTVTYSTDTQ